MKNFYLCIIALLMIAGQSFAQEKTVPEKVKTAFNSKFPNAEKVNWEMEDQEWEAEFKLDGKKLEAVFNSQGVWIETEQEINLSEVPEIVLNALDEEFESYEIDEIEKVERADGVFYEFKIEADDSEEITIYEVLISKSGKIISKEIENDSEMD